MQVTCLCRTGSTISSLDKVSLQGNSLSLGQDTAITIFTAQASDIEGGIELIARDAIMIQGGELATFGQHDFAGGETHLEANEIHLQDGARIFSTNNAQWHR